MFYEGKPYVSVAQRRQAAAKAMAKRAKKGQTVSPVVVDGKKIATTFWGESWCKNLEAYSDYSNRLPRGRTYVRNGSVVDLQIAPRTVSAVVSGSNVYNVTVRISALSPARWKAIRHDCVGSIDSLVELLQGRFSTGVMRRLCQQSSGLFPSPQEIDFSCSCPDWAAMCKHVAAVLYGIGVRLDRSPELLFKLREVDGADLVSGAGAGAPMAFAPPDGKPKGKRKVMAGGDLASMFGIEMAPDAGPLPKAERSTDAHDAVAVKRTQRMTSIPGRSKPGPRVQKPTGLRPTSMALQATYLGVLQGLDASARNKVRAVAKREGVPAAITLGRKLMKQK